MRVVILMVVLMLWSSPSWAAPSVSSVSGTLTSGTTLTVAGSGFGTKPTAAPWVWDNFESGSVGTELAAPWEHYTGHGTPCNIVYPKLATLAAHNGAKGIRATNRDCNNAVMNDYFNSYGQRGKAASNTTELYYSLWYRWSINSPAVGGNRNKLIRANSTPAAGEDTYYTPLPSFWVTSRNNSSSPGSIYLNGNGGSSICCQQ